MSNLNKKGMASIVQVSLLIMLSVMAISLIWGYVSDLSSGLENQLSPAVDCISQSSTATKACINSDGKIELNIDVGLEEKVSNLDINYLGQSFVCGQTCGSCNIIDSQGMKKVYLSTQNPASVQERVTVSINKCLSQVLTLSAC